jgi:hypothetical protein
MARKAIRVERKSTDTVTNFTRTEAGYFFGDDRPVAIVAQEQHLERIMRVIAPRTLRRDYLGLIVPENGQVWTEGFARRALSRAILLGMNPYTPKLVEKTSRRSELVWKVVNGVRRPEPSEVYRTLDAPEATDSQA